MKKIILVLFCLTLTTAFALATDYHLFQTQILDGKNTGRSGLAGTFPPGVWVLIQSDGQQPEVFQKFDSQQMEAWLHLRARGSAVHVHASPVLIDPISSAQWAAFKAFCQTNSITFINDSLGD